MHVLNTESSNATVRPGLGPDCGTLLVPILGVKKMLKKCQITGAFFFYFAAVCVEIKFGLILFGRADGASKC